MAIIENACSSVVKKVVAQEAATITKILKDKVSEQWSAYIGNKELDSYQKKILSYLYFFTINNPDKKSYIDDVYVPSGIKGADDKLFEVDALLGVLKGFSVVSGVAGHGKSTFLRYLMKKLIVSDELTEIPVFFELKYFTDKTIELQISDWFNLNGLKVSETLVIKLLKGGRLVLFLDAFDELPTSEMDVCEQRITEFHQRFSNINLIITTRPNLQITKNSHANHYKMADLDRGKVIEIINRVCDGKTESSNAARSIFSSKFVSEAIKTPIFVVLVCLTYKRWLSIPSTMSGFYDRVFTTLLSIHDNTKSGKRINRGVKTDLEDLQILEAICNLSYYLSIEEKYNFSKLEFDKACLKALKNQSNDESNLNAIYQCIKNSCNILILDGFDDYKYIHRSFQEFYTAKYIESLHRNKKKIFYSKCLEDEYFKAKHYKVLDFLLEIDEIYIYELLFIPYFLNEGFLLKSEYMINEINFEPLILKILRGKSVSEDFSLVQTKFDGLYIYSVLLGDDFVNELSDKIDEIIRSKELSSISVALLSSTKIYNRFVVYSAFDIVNCILNKDDLIKEVLEGFERELNDAEQSFDEKLDNIIERIESNSDDVLDL